eukprot:756503-Hanusia_phi.AAC.3
MVLLIIIERPAGPGSRTEQARQWGPLGPEHTHHDPTARRGFPTLAAASSVRALGGLTRAARCPQGNAAARCAGPAPPGALSRRAGPATLGLGLAAIISEPGCTDGAWGGTEIGLN